MRQGMTREGMRFVGVGVAVTIALTIGVLTAPGAAAKSTKAVVGVGRASGVGVVLVDKSGMTLYTLTNNGAAVPCDTTCQGFWPPYDVTAGAKVTGAKGVKKLGVTDTNQVTVNGLPVYRYSGDSKKGQANGEGINTFGGIWHVVKKSGASASSTPTKTTGSSTGGYGY
jgi:predicted lipoprotein with Yx(FWY)xxD motif